MARWNVSRFVCEYPGGCADRSKPLGLFELLNYQDISVVQGSGLGGTSLINANVAMVPEREVFESFPWPSSITWDALQPFFKRAQDVLGVVPHPRAMSLKKVQALERRARELGTVANAAPIAVNFTIDGPNSYGVNQKPCVDCGDCVTGCNFGAKNTLYMNYLPMARNAGAEIFTQTKVRWIEKLDTRGWRIHGRRYRAGGTSETFTLDAAHVILAAGAINSTEILMRSEMHGLPFSPALGTGFTASGDFFLAYNGDYENEALGCGSRTRGPSRPSSGRTGGGGAGGPLCARRPWLGI
jgi:cholesterol oxidase